MADQYWTTPVPQFPVAAGAAFASFTTLQDISPVPAPMIFGGQLRVGSKIELEAEGEFSNTSTPTLALAFLYGAVAGAAGGVTLGLGLVTTTTTATVAWPWRIKLRGTVTATGTAGSILVQGEQNLPTSITTVVSTFMPITQALRTVAIDTTINKPLGVGAVWGTSSASNTIKVNNFSAILIN